MKAKFILLIIFFFIISASMIAFGPIQMSMTDLLKVFSGSSDNQMLSDIIFTIRVPKLLTAIFAGAALATAGLIMQSYFGNPLAGPFVLGINSGASLGVAFWMLGATYIATLPEFFIHFGTSLFAILGSFIILFILLFLSFRITGKIVLLVVGLMFGHMSNGLINILMVIGEADNIKSFMMWGLGSFSRVDNTILPWFTLCLGITLIVALMQIKKLNLLLLGDQYAKSLGVNIKKIKVILISLTAILSGLVTAFCGPISFVGVIVPHIARAIFKSSDHKIIMPSSMLIGAVVCIFGELISSSSFGANIPVNAVMGLVGAPVIFIFLWKKRKSEGMS